MTENDRAAEPPIDVEAWYAAFETVTGTEASTPGGKQRIFDDFWRAFRERTRPPGGPKYGGPPKEPE